MVFREARDKGEMLIDFLLAPWNPEFRPSDL